MSERKPDVVLALWDEVPGRLGDSREDYPSIEVYRSDFPTGSAILVCPGGGYARRASHEAGVVAEWLNTLGITGIVVHYRVAPYKHPQPLNDLSQAVRISRQRSDEWGIDPLRIGVLGFSAGGHLAATLSTHYTPDTRPALSILLYPVITLHPPSAHTGSRQNLLADPTDPDLVNLLSNEMHVTPDTPPAFMFHTVSDPGVPVENSLMYASALRKNGVKFELHCYQEGRHGVGLAQNDPILGTWPMLCANWLRLQGFAR